MNVEEWTITINVAAEDALAVLDSVTEKVRTLANEKQWQSVQQTFDAKPVVNFDNAVEHVLITVDSAAKETAAGVDKVTKAGEEAESAFEGVLKGIGGAAKSFFSREWIIGFIDLITTIPDIIKWIGAEQEKAREAERQREAERIQANREAVQEQQSRVERLNALTRRYHELSGKETLNYSEQREMVSIKRELADAYGVIAENANAAAEAQRNYNASLDEASRKELQELLDTKKQATQDAYLATQTKESAEAFKDMASAYIELKEAREALESGSYVDNGIDEDKARERVENAKAAYSEASEALKAFEGSYTDWFNASIDEQLTAIEAGGGKVDIALADFLIGLFDIDLSSFGGDTTAADKWVDSMVLGLAAACKDADTAEALEAARGIMDNVLTGAAPTDADVDTFTTAWATIFNPEGTIMPWLEMISEATGTALPVLQETLMEALTGFTGFAEGAATGAESAKVSLNGIAEEAAAAGNALDVLGESFDWTGASASDATAQANRLVSAYKTLANTVKTLDNKTGTLEKGQKALIAAQKKGITSVKAAGKEVQSLAKDVGYSGDSIEDLNALLPAYAKKLQKDLAGAQSGLQSLQGELVNAAACANVDGSVRVEAAGALESLQAFINMALFAIALLGQLGGDVSKPKSGGGGGKKDDAEEAARAAEEARKEAIRRDYDMIDHKRHMNEITLEEELELLEAIRRNHQLNAEEIMDWEEKVYDLKKELRERDAESIDQLGDAVVDALEARYEAMRDAELERLDASREAWEKWRDDSVKAIEDQIDALDKLSETEDREKKDAEELRKIAKLRQQIEFEQDDYNRAKLQQQLEQALSSREDRLHKLALEDQKDALREQIEQIEQKADDEISAIDKEQDEIEKAYDEWLKEAALRAEAEKLMMTQSQQQILDLLKEYAPDYDATGQTLGEKLLEGFQKKVGGIADWFKSFNAQMAKAQEQMAAMAQEAAGTFYQQQSERNQTQSAVPPTVVNQTVQFNEPVESPSQVARRIEQVNEELSVLLS